MKIRKGFVSNSSSSSFVVKLDYLSADQLRKLENYDTEGDKMGMQYAEGWHIDVDDNKVVGTTTMDNFDMEEFMKKIGVDMSKVHWDRD